MTIIDANLGEIQSLELSYERMRLAENMPYETAPMEEHNE